MNILNKILEKIFIIISWLIWIINIIIFIIIWDFYYYIHNNKNYLWDNFKKQYQQIINQLSNNIKIIEINNKKSITKYVVSLDTRVDAIISFGKWKKEKKILKNIKIKDVLLICKWILQQKKNINTVQLNLLDKNKKILRKIIYKQNKIKELLWF